MQSLQEKMSDDQRFWKIKYWEGGSDRNLIKETQSHHCKSIQYKMKIEIRLWFIWNSCVLCKDNYSHCVNWGRQSFGLLRWLETENYILYRLHLAGFQAFIIRNSVLKYGEGLTKETKPKNCNIGTDKRDYSLIYLFAAKTCQFLSFRSCYAGNTTG